MESKVDHGFPLPRRLWYITHLSSKINIWFKKKPCCGATVMTRIFSNVGACFPRTEHEESIFWISTPSHGYEDVIGRFRQMLQTYVQAPGKFSVFYLIFCCSWTLFRMEWQSIQGMLEAAVFERKSVEPFWVVRSLTEVSPKAEHILLVASAALFSNLNS